jgi:hypothetical protein
VLALGEAEARRLCRKYNVQFPVGTEGFEVDAGPVVLVVVLDGRLDTLVHECCHACLDILGNAGINPRASHGEPLCYLLDNMFEHFRKALV